MQNPADDAPIIDPTGSGATMRQMRFDGRPCFVVQPIEILHGSLQQCLRERIESETPHKINYLIWF
jgi:hypothetical protein